MLPPLLLQTVVALWVILGLVLEMVEVQTPV
jgi:hypothetical protein